MWTTPLEPKFPNGITLYMWGHGPRILFLHGVGLRGDFWNGIIPHLINDYAMLPLNLPGHAESGNIPSNVTSIADFTDLLIKGIPVKPDYIVGHSLGSLIALDWAARYGENLKGIVALNAIYYRSKTAQRAVIERAENLKSATHIDPTKTLTRWFGNGNSEEKTACKNWLTNNRIDQYAHAYEVFARSNGPSLGAIKSLKMPVLFITGACEPNSTPAMSREMAKLTPRGSLHIVEGAAHMAPMTHAKEIAFHMKDFFNACGEEE